MSFFWARFFTYKTPDLSAIMNIDGCMNTLRENVINIYRPFIFEQCNNNAITPMKISQNERKTFLCDKTTCHSWLFRHLIETKIIRIQLNIFTYFDHSERCFNCKRKFLETEFWRKRFPNNNWIQVLVWQMHLLIMVNTVM